MKIGVAKEIKDKEHRIALTPEGARRLAGSGHEVRVEGGAGTGSGFSDEEYTAVGAKITDAATAWNADLVLKVKEPMPSEYRYLQGQIVFTYFHLAGVPRTLTEALLGSGTTAIAYETVEDSTGRLPLLAPMSAIAGNMATLMGAYYLARFNHGRGVQLGRVMGEPHGKVVIIGDGVVGRHAAATAVGMGATVHIAGEFAEREAELKREVSPDLHYLISTPDTIAREIRDADLLVGAILLHGAKAPHVVTESMVRNMLNGAVVVDVSIDQGGCIETSRPTSHSDPVYERHGVIHYCVTNMPGAYPRTSTIALENATFPYVSRLADQGLGGVASDPGFLRGLNTYQGYITCEPVAEALDMGTRYRALTEFSFH
jgi:alanine dehydrogenase